MSKDIGGPAFPIPSDGLTHGPEPGMTLRDWFAGMALQSLISSYKGPALRAVFFATASYEVADAMLAERAK